MTRALVVAVLVVLVVLVLAEPAGERPPPRIGPSVESEAVEVDL